MQTTFGVPYPSPDDPVSAGADDIRAVAEALDSRVLAGRLDWGPAGGPPDTGLYRSAPGAVKSDGNITAMTLNANNALGVQRDIYTDLAGVTGRIYFGASADTSLYRVSAEVLGASGELMARAGSEYQVRVGYVGGTPGIYFGQTADTSLYRQAANQLRTDGYLTVGGNLAVSPEQPWSVNIGYVDGNAGIFFGTETKLYRSAAGVLQTDGRFHAAGSLMANSAYIVLGGLPGAPANTAVLKLGSEDTSGYGSLGGDRGVYLGTASRFPPTPVQGGVLFVVAGALHYKGTNGTDTIIAPA